MSRDILIKKNLSILLAIIITASSLSVISYQYSVYTSEEVSRIASDDIVLNAQNEAYDLSRIVVNRMDSVTSNLQVLANAPSIQSGDAGGIAQLFDAAQYSTEDLTEYYMWLDSDGTIRTASNVARASYLYNMLWQSEEPPFLTEPQKTGGIYYSGIIKSPSDNIERLYVAYPIVYSLQKNELLVGDFRGVIVASIRLDTLGAILTNELSPTFQSDVSLADITGVMIYSVDKSAIGKNILENPSYLTTPVLSGLRGDAEAEIIQFLENSNVQRQAGIKSISTGGKSFTLASHPIIHNGNHFWTLYIIAPHVLTNNVADLLVKQGIFTVTILIVIGAVSVGVAYLILSWNKRLEATVRTRTLELRNVNISLTESNEQLALANEQLELHGRLQREFIDVAAHELRTPIMPILGMTDILESKFHQSKNGEIILKRSDFEIISRNARRLERLATDTLDATKIETHSLHLNKEQFNLYEVAELAVDDIKNQFPNDRIRYVMQMNRDMHIFADRSKLTRVLSNLLSNAAKFTDDGSIMVGGKVETSANGQNTVHISVSDTGIGIDSEVLPRLFTKFSNKAGADRAQVGSGLGLYISKGIVEAHGGKIWAENNKGGRGCTFWIDIPLMSQEITS